MKKGLPFKIGDLAESKSFDRGFRGAWFRCKIKDMAWVKSHMCYSLEFFDFPDEKVGWTKLYLKPPLEDKKPRDKISSDEKKRPLGDKRPRDKSSLDKKKLYWKPRSRGRKPRDKSSQDEKNKAHLMVRPNFPPVCHESVMPDISTIPEAAAITDGVWKVGDLVDWWYEDCYWSGKITDVVGENEVKIKLPEPPVGEGGEPYHALCKDLRPSLDWSPQLGWTVPISTESEIRQSCARLIQPVNRDGRTTNGHANVGALSEFSADSSRHGAAGLSSSPAIPSYPTRQIPNQPLGTGFHNDETTPNTLVGLELGDGSSQKPSSSDSVSSAHGDGVPAAAAISNAHGDGVPAAAAKTTGKRDRYSNEDSSKKMQFTGSEYLNSSSSDTIESALLDLEELDCRIKWLKRVHQFGVESVTKMTPLWEFLKNR